MKSHRKLHIAAIFVLVLISPHVLAQLHDYDLRYAKMRTEYDSNVGTALDQLTLWYTNNGLEGDEGCLFDEETSFYGCPGRAGIDVGSSSPTAQVWWGTGQYDFGCCEDDEETCETTGTGERARIGDSWYGCLRYDDSPAFSENSPGSSYWVISANEDPAFDSTCQEGPPNLSHEINDHGQNPNGELLYNVKTSDVYVIGAGWRKKVYLKVNSGEKDRSCREYSQAFLAFGSQKGAGNSNYPGEMQRGSTTVRDRLRFKMGVTDYSAFSHPSTNSVGVHAGFFVIAEWSGPANPGDTSINYPKIVWVSLVGTGVLDYGDEYSENAKWNWPISESFYWPGAEIMFTNAETVEAECSGITIPSLSTTGGTNSYDINLTDLFVCASDTLSSGFSTDFPSSEVNITGVHFYIEEANAASGELEVVVQQVKMDY